MKKLKTLVVPKGIGRWLDHQELGKESTIFTVINNLDQLFRINLDNRTGYFIMLNKKELIEVIIGSRDYKVEDELYYALIKGHEILSNNVKYWVCDERYKQTVFINFRNPLSDMFTNKLTKKEWNDLGVNDANADFVRAEEYK